MNGIGVVRTRLPWEVVRFFHLFCMSWRLIFLSLGGHEGTIHEIRQVEGGDQSFRSEQQNMPHVVPELCLPATMRS